MCVFVSPNQIEREVNAIRYTDWYDRENTSYKTSVSSNSLNSERASSMRFSFCSFSARIYSDIIIVSCLFDSEEHF